MGCITVKIGLDKYIAREKKLLLDYTFSVTDLGILLCWQQNLTNTIGQILIVPHQCLEVFLDFSFLSAYRLQDIPLFLCHSHFLQQSINLDTQTS